MMLTVIKNRRFIKIKTKPIEVGESPVIHTHSSTNGLKSKVDR